MNKITRRDVMVADDPFWISLSKLTGKQVIDIRGRLAIAEWGPTLCLSAVIFDDGSELSIEGEHDFPYVDGEQPNLDEETLERLYDEEWYE